MRVPGFGSPGHKVWPVEGAQCHTKLNVEFGGGEGKDTVTEEGRRGEEEREDKFPGCFPWPLEAPPQAPENYTPDQGRDSLPLALFAIFFIIFIHLSKQLLSM